MPSSLGPAEILVILVVALIVLGPKRLPEAGRQVGKALSEVRRWSQDVKYEMNQAFTVDASPTEGATWTRTDQVPPPVEVAPPAEVAPPVEVAPPPVPASPDPVSADPVSPDPVSAVAPAPVPPGEQRDQPEVADVPAASPEAPTGERPA